MLEICDILHYGKFWFGLQNTDLEYVMVLLVTVVWDFTLASDALSKMSDMCEKQSVLDWLPTLFTTVQCIASNMVFLMLKFDMLSCFSCTVCLIFVINKINKDGHMVGMLYIHTHNNVCQSFLLCYIQCLCSISQFI